MRFGDNIVSAATTIRGLASIRGEVGALPRMAIEYLDRRFLRLQGQPGTKFQDWVAALKRDELPKIRYIVAVNRPGFAGGRFV
jgi:hypothetical protein